MQDTTKPRVLVVDDEAVIRDLLQRILIKQGYEVSTATDGLEGLDKIKHNNYNILILDLKMPRMDGMGLLREIRELEKDFIIIIITGYENQDTSQVIARQGCLGYITKPFNIEEVNITIKRAWDMHRSRSF